MADYNTYTDEDLTDLLKSNDHAAYEKIYQRYWLVLYRHARKMLQDEEEARDVVQDVFVTLWSKREELTLNTSLSAYLYVAVRNKILNLFKRSKIENNHMDSLKVFINKGENITDHLLREKNLSEIIEQEIALLPLRMRQVFELKRKSNLSYKEIAEEMTISDLTVKTQMNKAIKILRLRLGSVLSSFL
jgi:RNA polymerase sigma-70 factor (ECF subfamily)